MGIGLLGNFWHDNPLTSLELSFEYLSYVDVIACPTMFLPSYIFPCFAKPLYFTFDSPLSFLFFFLPQSHLAPFFLDLSYPTLHSSALSISCHNHTLSFLALTYSALTAWYHHLISKLLFSRFGCARWLLKSLAPHSRPEGVTKLASVSHTTVAFLTGSQSHTHTGKKEERSLSIRWSYRRIVSDRIVNIDNKW